MVGRVDVMTPSKQKVFSISVDYQQRGLAKLFKAKGVISLNSQKKEKGLLINDKIENSKTI